MHILYIFQNFNWANDLTYCLCLIKINKEVALLLRTGTLFFAQWAAKFVINTFAFQVYCPQYKMSLLDGKTTLNMSQKMCTGL